MATTKRFYTVTAVLGLVVASLIVFSLNVRSTEKTGFFKKVVLEIAAPLENAVSLAFRSIDLAWERYVLLVGVERKNRDLNARVVSLIKEVNDYREMSIEYGRLRKLMDLKDDSGFSTVVARVVGRNRLSGFRTILINKGTADGIKNDFPVIAEEGMVGRVIEVSWNVSKVLLLVDYNSNIDALIQRNRYRGVLQGSGKSECELKYVQRSEDVKVGDVVMSSGLAGVFPKGLVLGKVVEVNKEASGLFQRIGVCPVLDITRLEEVLVILMRTGNDR
ncbi:MAG: rod shape-determining protein MreC [Thermodesulfobacteriota bacterium]|nr:rod shape-determining protein MreC [Thermodesulfobacteriota bacterium]